MNLCMVGVGYVGLVSGTCFAEFGNRVYCVDNDPAKIELLQAGKIPFYIMSMRWQETSAG